MAVIFMFVFILSMTIFAFWGNGTEEAGDRAVRIGAVPAGQLVAFHAAVTRACSAQPANCPANAYVYKAVAGPFLSPPYDPTALPFRDGDYRLSSWFDGTTVYTYYTGIRDAASVDKVRDVEMRTSATAWLNENLPQHALGNVGTYNAATRQFVARNYASSTSYNGTVNTVSSPNGTSSVNMNGYIPDGAPMMRSKIKTEININ